MDKWFWKIYAVFFLSVALARAWYFLNPQEEPMLYYAMMTRFYSGYYLPLSLETCNHIATVAASVPVFLYAFDVKNMMPVWRWLFYARIFTDLAGHHYTFKSIQSGFSDSLLLGFITIAALAFPLIPSYLAHFRYAFKQK